MNQPPTDKAYPAELKTLLEQAARGDEGVLPALRKAFDKHPELVTLFGDLAEHARQAVLRLAAGSCLTAREAIGRTADDLGNRLSATANSELEKLLIDRVVISWVEVYHGDIDLARRLLETSADGSIAKAAQTRLDSAHRRFLSAVKALATVQKLLKPSPSAFDLLRRPVNESPGPWAGRGRTARVPSCN
jgi:hypothetical protein